MACDTGYNLRISLGQLIGSGTLYALHGQFSPAPPRSPPTVFEPLHVDNPVVGSPEGSAQ